MPSYFFSMETPRSPMLISMPVVLCRFLVELITQDLPVHQDCPPNSLVLFPTTSNSY
jgi:hypothetical protein